MEVTVTQILGWQRNVQGCTVVLDVDLGGTVRETLRSNILTNGRPSRRRTRLPGRKG